MLQIKSIPLLLVFTYKICGGIFPYAEYFGMVDQPGSHMKIMMELYYLCSSPIKQNNMMRCECSPNCMKFHSCCMDYLWQSDRDETLKDYTDRFLLEAEKYDHLECNPIVIGLPENKYYSVQSLLMRSRCPQGADQYISDKCATLKGRQSIRPVIGSDGYVYKNKYCALCNDNGEFTQINITAKHCTTDTKLPNTSSFFDRNTGCRFEIVEMTDTIAREKSIRTCSVKSYSENRCKTTESKSCQLCSNYLSEFSYENSDCYKNFHCFLGNQKQNGSIDKASKTLIECSFFQEAMAFSTYGYSILVSFNDLSDKPCKEHDEIYDDISNKCIVDAICGHGYTQVGLTCKSNMADPGNSQNQFSEKESLCLSNTVFFTLKINDTNNQSYVTDFQKNFPKSKILHRTQSEITFQTKMNTSQPQSQFEQGLGNHYETQIRSTLPDQFITELYGLDFTRLFKDGRICAMPVIYKNVIVNSTKDCSLDLNNTMMAPKDYVINIYVNGSRNDRRYVQLVTCKQYHLSSSCLKRMITSFVHFPKHGNIMAEDQVYKAGEYVPMENGIAVCISAPTTEKLESWERVMFSVDHYFTIVGCSCSIVCYIWVMLTYTIIPALKTIPGKNIVSLCFVLMFCDIIMLCGNVDLQYAMCASFGVLLHYFALSTQFWAGIVAFDIWSTFNNRSMTRDVKSQKRFRLYVIVGFLFPVLMVSLCAVLEFTKTIDFGYGVNKVCWITRFHPRLVAYIIPMIVITSCNIVLLSYTIHYIRKHAKKSKKLLKKSGGGSISLARMSLKLVVLLGAIEILGLVQTRGDSTDGEKVFNGIFRAIYSFVRAFRGVFIFLLYIVTDRVFNVYRDIKSQRSLYTRSSTISHSTKENIRRSSSKKLMETSYSST